MNRPKSVMCYICGREYGTHSIDIHIKTCKVKWENEQQLLPKSQRRPLPQPPVSIQDTKKMNQKELEEYNNQAYKEYNEKSLVPCENCGRTFRQEALQHHIKACSTKNPFKAGTEKQQKMQPCALCKKQFPIDRIQNHETVCKGVQNQESTPKKDFQTNQQKQQQSSQKLPQRPKTLMCYICGKEYGTKSLSIHLKTCKEKFTLEQSKKPREQRKQIPQEPQGLMELLQKDNITLEDIEQYNNKAFDKYNKEGLEACPNCARTFTADALSHHIKACKPGKNSQQQQQIQKPIIKPKTIMCHICGREYGTMSIGIHIPQCEKKWINEQEKLPKNQRKPIPQAPKSISQDFTKATQEQLDQFNQEAYNQYNDQALTQCQYCERTFTDSAFKHHQKACTAEKPMSSIKKVINQTEKLNIGQNNQQIEEQVSQQTLVQCSKCQRKFNEDRIQKHENICKSSKN